MCFTGVCNCVTYPLLVKLFFLFKQKTAYEMRISDWSSDVCSSDLALNFVHRLTGPSLCSEVIDDRHANKCISHQGAITYASLQDAHVGVRKKIRIVWIITMDLRSEVHTSELQSLMRISYAVFCLQKKKKKNKTGKNHI